ncbi:MAG: hypothetical protein LC687_00105 [Actinobacteria bacterium]|nr:hypothetical protein [Actinomycetota bacterium]
MTATPQTVDFSRVPDKLQAPSGKPGMPGEVRAAHLGNDNKPRTPDGKILTGKQIRARARRKARRTNIMTEAEFSALYKPVEEWDLEELAKGRPRNSRGHFTGPAPAYLPREVHEKALERFRSVVKGKMNEHTVTALDAIDWVLQNEEVDEKGKPIIPAGTKLDAAKFLIEHVIGKPTQRTESELSIKLQSILGVVMANPDQALMPQIEGGQGYSVGHLPGVTMAMATAEDDILDAEVEDEDNE